MTSLTIRVFVVYGPKGVYGVYLNEDRAFNRSLRLNQQLEGDEEYYVESGSVDSDWN